MPNPRIPKSHGKTHIGTVYLGGVFDDGGGIEISPTKDGGVVIIRIPPSAPVFERLAAAAVVFARAQSAKSTQLREQLTAYANELAAEALAAAED